MWPKIAIGVLLCIPSMSIVNDASADQPYGKVGLHNSSAYLDQVACLRGPRRELSYGGHNFERSGTPVPNPPPENPSRRRSS